MPTRLKRTVAGLALVLAPSMIVVACESTPIANPPATAPPVNGGSATRGTQADPYDDLSRWVCRPDRVDVCDGDLDTTVVTAEGRATVQPWTPAADPAVDCFYVYPTVSRDPGANSDLNLGAEEEIRAVRAQVARFGSTCRVFAPAYRQLTVSAVASMANAATAAVGESSTGSAPTTTLAGNHEAPGDQPADIAYNDVVRAFLRYAGGDGQGRGFILIGHSQGSSILARLINDVVRSDPDLTSRMVAAYLIGLPVGPRPDPGVPACPSATATGCVVAYSTFRATDPPRASTIFSRKAGDAAGCTNPAALTGTAPALHPVFLTEGRGWLPEGAGAVTTPFVSTPDLLLGACRDRDPFSWLEVTVAPAATDRRADNVGGEVGPGWGMHLIDMQVAQDDLIALAARQGDAWNATH